MNKPVFTGEDWVTIHAKHWRSWLAPFVGKRDGRGLELGVYEARSAIWWMENVLTGPGSRLIAIDVWHGWDEIYERAVTNCAPYAIDLRRTSSRWGCAQLLTCGDTFDFAYVDADHAAASCLADLCAAWHLLRPGGVLIADDYEWSSRTRPIPPRVAIDAWLSCHRDKIVGYEIAGGQAAFWKPK